MNELSIIKRIDELGRIVLPIEIRKKLKITTNDDLKITLENSDVIIRKYSILSDIEKKINTYGKIINKLSNKNVIITNKEKIIYSNDNNLLNKEISDYFKNLIIKREEIDSKKDIELIVNINKDNYFYIKNIIINNEVIGLVILYSDNLISNEEKLIIKIILLLLNDSLLN